MVPAALARSVVISGIASRHVRGEAASQRFSCNRRDAAIRRMPRQKRPGRWMTLLTLAMTTEKAGGKAVKASQT